MSEEFGGGLDSMFMGGVSEGVSESDEKFQERLAAAQQRIAAVKRSESKVKKYDAILSEIIKKIPYQFLDVVVFLLDHDMPSLTIIAVLALISPEASKTCHKEFHHYIEEAADVSAARFKSQKIEHHVSLWWTYIFAADFVSESTHFYEYRANEKFIPRFSVSYLDLLRYFFKTNQYNEFDEKGLKEALYVLQNRLFHEDKELQVV